LPTHKINSTSREQSLGAVHTHFERGANSNLKEDCDTLSLPVHVASAYTFLRSRSSPSAPSVSSTSLLLSAPPPLRRLPLWAQHPHRSDRRLAARNKRNRRPRSRLRRRVLTSTPLRRKQEGRVKRNCRRKLKPHCLTLQAKKFNVRQFTLTIDRAIERIHSKVQSRLGFLFIFD
jgi:hypothetical protein